jgi:hypothetical protein
MGFLDRFRKKVTVPVGFRVQTWPGETDAPAFTRMDGGVWLASTGPGGSAYKPSPVSYHAPIDRSGNAVQRDCKYLVEKA